MSLNNNNSYNYYTVVKDIIDFLSKHNLEMYGILDVMNKSNHHDFIKVYLNFNHNHEKIIAHKPFCPHKINLVSGFADATENVLWFGMINKDEIKNNFNDIQTFLDSLSNIVGISKKVTSCNSCNP